MGLLPGIHSATSAAFVSLDALTLTGSLDDPEEQVLPMLSSMLQAASMRVHDESLLLRNDINEEPPLEKVHPWTPICDQSRITFLIAKPTPHTTAVTPAEDVGGLES